MSAENETKATDETNGNTDNDNESEDETSDTKEMTKENKGAKSKEMSDENKEFLKKYGIEVLQYLASGAFASVFKAKWSDKIFAVKEVALNDENKERQKTEIDNEKKIANTMNHKNIIRCHKVLDIEDKFVFFVNDFADGGDLITVLEKLDEQNEKLDELMIRKWFLDVVEGVAHMHNKGYVHRDIKADNILLRRDNPKINELVAKVTDFGFSHYSLNSKKEVILVNNYLGTIEYSSPENAICKIDEGNPFDPFKSDVYSLGILLYVMATLKFPFTTGRSKRPSTRPEIRRLHKKMMDSKWRKLKRIKENKLLSDLLEKLLEPEASNRPNASTIKDHKWSKGEDSESQSEDSDDSND